MDRNVAKHTSTKKVFNEIREYVGGRTQLLYPLCVIPFLGIAGIEMLLGVEWGKSSDVMEASIKFCPILIGLCFAMMVFLYKTDEKTKNRLMVHTDKGIAPVRVFFAMITWFILTLLLVFIIALLSSVLPHLLIYALLYGSMCYAMYILVQVILEMYTFHTFFFPLDEKEMEKRGMKE